MGQMIHQATASRQPVLPDIGRPVMAKGDARVPDIEWPAIIGAAIQDAVNDARWSNKEAAAKVGVDDAEFGKWVSGTRRPQFDKVLAVPELRWPIIVALAVRSGEAETITTLRRTS